MSIHYEIQILRSKLIAMTRLTQRTVDYSIKAFQLGRPELCRVVQNSREEIGAIRGWIANRGRALLAASKPESADSRFVCAALRISTALEAACDAGFNIARHSAIRFAEGWTPISPELLDAGNFVNSQLRLCILSLLKKDLRHAKAVLHNASAGQSFDLAVYLAHHDLAQRTNAHARFELALVRCLDGIAGQTREIADALLEWHDEIERRESAEQGAQHQTTALALDAATFSSFQTPSSCKMVVSTTSPRQASGLIPSDEGCFPPRSISRAVPVDDFTQARLTGLQQRVCELLVKNQQLRMALMAERTDSHQEQLC